MDGRYEWSGKVGFGLSLIPIVTFFAMIIISPG